MKNLSSLHEGPPVYPAKVKPHEESEEVMELKARHKTEITRFKNLMAELKDTYDAREEAYQRKIAKCKAECEIRVQEF